MDWFGIRTIYHSGRKVDGTNLFEERICVFSGKDWDEAFEKAAREADAYASDLKLSWHTLQEAYQQDGESLIDGYEVFSQMFEFKGDLDQFFQERYGRFEYKPDA